MHTKFGNRNERKYHPEHLSVGYKFNIEMDLREVQLEGVKQIELMQVASSGRLR
jgi:hypothetical protein